MGGYAVKKISEMRGPYSGSFKLARAELGVSSFGIAVIEIPPGWDGYPEHDHAGDGQEEVYLALQGGGEIEVEGERHPLDTETMVRVSPGTTRKIWPGESGIRVLVVGAAPGEVYEAPERSKLKPADPATPAE